MLSRRRSNKINKKKERKNAPNTSTAGQRMTNVTFWQEYFFKINKIQNISS